MHEVVVFALLLQAGSWPVASIRVQGLTRFDENGVAAAAGLKVKARAGAAETKAQASNEANKAAFINY